MVQQRLNVEFFDRHHLIVAKEMIGTHLNWDGVGGMIVETEAYAAQDDPACHTSFRPSAREFFKQHSPGIVYAYISYGIHWMLNVLTRDGIVLVRAIEPTIGLLRIKRRRGMNETRQLCSGPGKLGQSLLLKSQDHGTSLISADRFLLSRNENFDESGIAADVRVGLSVGLDRKWRFLLSANPNVSVGHGKAIGKARQRTQ